MEVIHNSPSDIYNALLKHFATFKLGVAGRLVYLSGDTFILGVHTTSPERAYEVAVLAWDNLPIEIKDKLKEQKLGFAVRMV